MRQMKIEGQSQWFDPVGRQRTETREIVVCEDCGCEWFDLICVQQYPKHAQVILGQRPAPIDDRGFWLYKCIKCGEVYEPPVQVGPQDAARKGYDAFLDHMHVEAKKPGAGEEV